MELELSDIVIGLAGLLFTVVFAAYKTQQDRRYKEDQTVKIKFREEIDKLKYDVLQNKERDTSAREEFRIYKETISNKDGSYEKVLDKIWHGIEKLGDRVQEYNTINQKAIDNLRQEFLASKNK